MSTQSIDLTQPQQDALLNFINQQLVTSLSKKASDIHVEPYQESYRIRCRYDGLLEQQALVPKQHAARLISRLKVMAGLDITETRLPQDGHLQVQCEDGNYNLRMSTCNTNAGEKLVLRLFNQSHLNLLELGLSEQHYPLFLKRIKQPQGLVLVCGPTGSGKTMTLYAALQLLNQTDKNLVSIEDPVEVFIDGINQVNIHEGIQLNFASALRCFLRQDPDIIMLGEIRDHETAANAVKAAQTGHLLLSTLHSNDCLSAITRLEHLGIKSYDLIEACNLIVSQRLLRRLCSHCKKLASCNTDHKKHYQAQGCEHCHQGYKGRIAVFELLPFTSQTINLLLNQESDREALFKQLNLPTLKQSAQQAVLEGKTSWQEYHRVIYDEDC